MKRLLGGGAALIALAGGLALYHRHLLDEEARVEENNAALEAVVENPDFYLFAQKQAELYRGELFSRSEMQRYARQASRAIVENKDRWQSACSVRRMLTDVDSLRELPYGVATNQRALFELHHCEQRLKQSGKKQSASDIRAIALPLERHYKRLAQAVNSFDEQ